MTDKNCLTTHLPRCRSGRRKSVVCNLNSRYAWNVRIADLAGYTCFVMVHGARSTRWRKADLRRAALGCVVRGQDQVLVEVQMPFTDWALRTSIAAEASTTNASNSVYSVRSWPRSSERNFTVPLLNCLRSAAAGIRHGRQPEPDP
jgi:hypothetical protein